VVVAGLLDPRWRVEIEAEAVVAAESLGVAESTGLAERVVPADSVRSSGPAGTIGA
jgi:hypothetical protein